MARSPRVPQIEVLPPDGRLTLRPGSVSRRSRGSRRRALRRRRLIILAALAAAAPLLTASLMWVSDAVAPIRLPDPPEAPQPIGVLVTPGEPLPEPAPVYPYSVVPGGVHSREQLIAAIATDSVVAAHYAGFRAGDAMRFRLTRQRRAHVSYRIGDRVYWTRRPVLLPAGEAVLTDGTHMIRERCGNCIDDRVRGETSELEPDQDVLETPLVPASDDELPSAGMTPREGYAALARLGGLPTAIAGDESPEDSVGAWLNGPVPGGPASPGGGSAPVPGGGGQLNVGADTPGGSGTPRSHPPGSPVDPIGPENPSEPGNPASPHVPGAPGTPGNPGPPAGPASPEPPTTPGSSGNPGGPETPGMPGSPGSPGSSGNPGTPGTPGNPSAPGTPGMPGNPGNQSVPGTPGGSSTPETPGSPGTPEGPGGGGSPGTPPVNPWEPPDIPPIPPVSPETPSTPIVPTIPPELAPDVPPESGETPEPATLALLTLGAGMLLARRALRNV